MIVLLHSSGSSPRQWSGLAERLAQRHRVEAPTLIGHDDQPGWRGARPSLSSEVEALVASIRFDEPVHLVGHSYGGAVAVKAALSGLLDVRSLAVYEPSLFDDDARPRDLHRLSIPSLVMSGNLSPRPSQDLCETVAGHLAGAHHHRFSGLGHMGPATHGERVFPVIAEFLEAVARPRVAPRAFLPDHLGWARPRIA